MGRETAFLQRLGQSLVENSRPIVSIFNAVRRSSTHVSDDIDVAALLLDGTVAYLYVPNVDINEHGPHRVRFFSSGGVSVFLTPTTGD